MIEIGENCNAIDNPQQCETEVVKLLKVTLSLFVAVTSCSFTVEMASLLHKQI